MKQDWSGWENWLPVARRSSEREATNSRTGLRSLPALAIGPVPLFLAQRLCNPNGQKRHRGFLSFGHFLLENWSKKWTNNLMKSEV